MAPFVPDELLRQTMLLFPIEFALQITVLFVPVREELLRRMSLLDPIKASLSTRYRQAARCSYPACTECRRSESRWQAHTIDTNELTLDRSGLEGLDRPTVIQPLSSLAENRLVPIGMIEESSQLLQCLSPLLRTFVGTFVDVRLTAEDKFGQSSGMSCERIPRSPLLEL